MDELHNYKAHYSFLRVRGECSCGWKSKRRWLGSITGDIYCQEEWYRHYVGETNK